MKKLRKLSLHNMAKTEMKRRETEMLKGGCSARCGCSCQYEGEQGGSNWQANLRANHMGELHTPGGKCCFGLGDGMELTLDNANMLIYHG